MKKIENPFITSGYVSSKYFCDRRNETEKLLFELSSGNNIVLISARPLLTWAWKR